LGGKFAHRIGDLPGEMIMSRPQSLTELFDASDASFTKLMALVSSLP